MAAARKPTEAQMEAMRQSRVADAYKEVFGATAAKRNRAQAIVWEDMQKVGMVKSPVFIADKAGQMCAMRAAHADGRRWVFLYIEANVTAEIKIPD